MSLCLTRSQGPGEVGCRLSHDALHAAAQHVVRGTLYAVVQVNNILKSGRADGPGYHWVAYDNPTVVVRFHDGYTGDLLSGEAVSTLDANRGAGDGPRLTKL